MSHAIFADNVYIVASSVPQPLHTFETLTDNGLFDGAIFDFDNDVCKGDGVPIHQDWKGNKYFH